MILFYEINKLFRYTQNPITNKEDIEVKVKFHDFLTEY